MAIGGERALYCRAGRSEQGPHELLKTQPFIRYDRTLWSGQLADEYLRTTGIQPKELMELDGLEAIAVLVDRGLGVSLVPNRSAPWPEGRAWQSSVSRTERLSGIWAFFGREARRGCT
ncbi:LysR substrate-binding domain-containing protein [Rhizobium leguminosarum]|uniref:LysR substrate-binding domain-containing protein n=1 Tax=Rhizobium leguminosarum TaxID=384 RepID=UPI001C8FCE81|nr:hypothetical protein [Rhizobium leguminosarum]